MLDQLKSALTRLLARMSSFYLLPFSTSKMLAIIDSVRSARAVISSLLCRISFSILDICGRILDMSATNCWLSLFAFVFFESMLDESLVGEVVGYEIRGDPPNIRAMQRAHSNKWYSTAAMN